MGAQILDHNPLVPAILHSQGAHNKVRQKQQTLAQSPTQAAFQNADVQDKNGRERL